MGGTGKQRKEKEERERRASARPASAAAAGAASSSSSSASYDGLIKQALELHDRGEKRSGAAGVECLRKCVAKYKEAEDLFPAETNSFDLHFNMACAYSTLGERLKEIDAEEAASVLLSACEHYGICVQFEASSEALNNWGVAIAAFAAMQEPAEALSLYETAVERLMQACQIDPRDFEAAANLGDTLCTSAIIIPDPPQALATFQRGNAEFERAISLMEYDCDRCDAMCNWGNALSSWAQRIAEAGNTAEAFEMYNAAVEKLTFVARVNNGDPAALANVGEVLRSQSEVAPAPLEVLQQALTAFESAIALDRSCEDAILGIGDTTLESGRILLAQQNPSAAMPLLQRSYEAYTRALAVKDDATVQYNAACACALAGEETRCIGHLQRVAALEPSVLGEMESDADFNAWRHTPWFAEFVRLAAT